MDGIRIHNKIIYSVYNLYSIFQIPLHCLDDPRLEILVCFPAKFFRQFGGVNGIAEVMSWPVCDKTDQIGISAFFPRSFFIQYPGNRMHDLQVVSFIMTADIVGFSGFSLMVDQIDRLAVIQYVQPVPYVLAISVYWNRFFCQTFPDNGRYLSLIHISEPTRPY